MDEPPVANAEDLARAMRAPFVPELAHALEHGGYLERVWPQLRPSVETAGFLGSALYMADMALDAVVEVYEPLMTPARLVETGALDEVELEAVRGTLDVFHWIQPQQLLLVAALAEAWDAASVGGQGRPSPREDHAREQEHLAVAVRLAPPDQPPLPEIAEALQLERAPEVYRAAAGWPRYLEAAWEELQHLAAFPLFRQRGRALYYYARSSSRFLAQPLHASADELRRDGMTDEDLQVVRATLDAALPALATTMMHTVAMRVGLGETAHEVVTDAGGG